MSRLEIAVLSAVLALVRECLPRPWMLQVILILTLNQGNCKHQRYKHWFALRSNSKHHWRAIQK
jgi:hypothetical protein